MTHSPEISVLMYVDHGGPHLGDAIRSVLSQSHSNFELIVIVDICAPEVEDILSTLDDPKIIAIRNPVRVGPAGSLNRAWRMAQGSVLAFQDQDGISVHGRLAVQLSHLRENPGVGATICVTTVGTEQYPRVPIPKSASFSSHARHLVKGDFPFALGSLMVQRPVVEESHGFDETLDDFKSDFFRRLSETGQLSLLATPLCQYRDRTAVGAAATVGYSEAAPIRQRAKERHLSKVPRGEIRTAHVEQMPLFSLLMANYNNARFIADSIESVLDQTAQNWELLICDDASTDNSLDIIQPYLGDARIRLLRNIENKGYIRSLNRLLAESRGEVIGTIDPDDALTFDAIEILGNAHRQHLDASFIYSQYLKCDKDLNAFDIGPCRQLAASSTLVAEDCASHFRTWKRWASDRGGGFSLSYLYAEDKDFLFRLEEQGAVVFVDEVTYLYRVLSESQSHGAKFLRGRASHQLARFHAWERRAPGTCANISRWEALEAVWYGLGLCINDRNWPLFFEFLRGLARHPACTPSHLRRFYHGLRS